MLAALLSTPDPHSHTLPQAVSVRCGGQRDFRSRQTSPSQRFTFRCEKTPGECNRLLFLMGKNPCVLHSPAQGHPCREPLLLASLKRTGG